MRMHIRSHIYPCVRCAGDVFGALTAAVAIALQVPVLSAAVPGEVADERTRLDNHVKEKYAKIAAAPARDENVTGQTQTLRR